MAEVSPTGAIGTPHRRRPVYLRGERDLLEGWLDFHRATMLEKCEGLSEEMRKARPVATSLLSLHGLIRHMGETERNWFNRILENDSDSGRIWADPNIKDSPLVPLDHADWEEDLSMYRAQCELSRQVAAARDLDDCGLWRDRPISLRSIYLQMIQEYARHNGHVDIIREMLDGTVGV